MSSCLCGLQCVNKPMLIHSSRHLTHTGVWFPMRGVRHSFWGPTVKTPHGEQKTSQTVESVWLSNNINNNKRRNANWRVWFMCLLCCCDQSRSDTLTWIWALLQSFCWHYRCACEMFGVLVWNIVNWMEACIWYFQFCKFSQQTFKSIKSNSSFRLVFITWCHKRWAVV